MFLEIAPVIRFLVNCGPFGFRLPQGGFVLRMTNPATIFAMATVCCARSFACLFAPLRNALPELRSP